MATSTAMMRRQLPTVDVVLAGGAGEKLNTSTLEDLNRRNVIHFNEKGKIRRTFAETVAPPKLVMFEHVEGCQMCYK